MFFKYSVVVSFLTLVGCASVETVTENKTVTVSSIASKSLNNKERVAKEKNKKIRRDLDNAGKQREAAVFEKFKEKAQVDGDMINLVVKYQGSYKTSEIDDYLIKTYQRRYVYKERPMGKGTYTTPVYEPLKMSRAGGDWKITVTEKLDGTFDINGKNSKGIDLKTVCKTLKDCFKLM